MARSYSPRRFLRVAPKELLRRYLALWNIPWPELAERGIEPLLEAIDSASEEVRSQIHADFQDIERLASHQGLAIIRDEACDPRWHADLGYLLVEGMELLEVSFQVFLDHPDIFKAARTIEQADKLRYYLRANIPAPIHPVSDETRARLSADLSAFFRREHSTGHGCEVEVLPRGNRSYYICHIEDHPETAQVFDDDHNLITQKRKPPFEVVFDHDPDKRTLRTSVRGGREVRDDVETIFGRVVLGVDLGPAPGRVEVHQLNGLLTPFELPTLQQDGLDYVHLRSLKLRVLGRTYRTITLSVGAKSAENELWQMLDALLACGQISKTLLVVKQAEFRAVFKARNGAKPLVRTFTVSHPDGCSLKPTLREDEVLMDCLRRWKLDVSGTDQDPNQQSGFGAQYILWPE